MKLVMLESPYAGDVETNIGFAQRCMYDCLTRGESPIASHLLYTQPNILDDNIAGHRDLGIKAGFAWARACDYHVFYTDLGWSSGMLAALHMLLRIDRPFYLRGLNKGVIYPAALGEDVDRILTRAASEEWQG